MSLVGVFGLAQGIQKISHAHGWNVPKINQKNDTDPTPLSEACLNLSVI